MVLLGDVGQVEEVRERARHRQRGVDRHAAEHVREALEVVAFAGAGALGQRAHVLDRAEQLFAFVRLSVSPSSSPSSRTSSRSGL